MTNWASTSYRIEGRKEELERVNNIINAYLNGETVTAKDKGWEGNLLMALGVTSEELENKYIRGFFQSSEITKDGTLRIEAEEAWSISDMKDVLTERMPGLTVYYYTEEQGCEVYQTNDDMGKYFPERFFVDAEVNGDYKSEYFETEEDADRYVANIIGNGKATYTEEELDDWNGSHNDDTFVNVHEIEYVA